MGTLVFQANLGGAINLIGPNTASTVNFTLPSADGTANQALVTNGSGTLSFSTVSSPPGGSTTQVQYNNAGAFAGSANMTFDGTKLTVAGLKDSALTSGRVTYATTSGELTDSANFNYDGSRLLLGLTSNLSGARLQAQGATDTAFTALTVNASTNDGYMGIGYNSSGSVWQIWPTYNTTAGYKPLAVVVGGSEVARFPTASGFQCVNSISVGNATPTTSGAGITFPATQSASSNANTLDDYEEGTWTPSLGGNTTYTEQVGTYTKVGRLVTIRFRINPASIGTGSTTTITGLPFTASGAGEGAVYWDTSLTNVVAITAYATSNQINLYSATAASASLTSIGIFKSGTTLDGTITYIV